MKIMVDGLNLELPRGTGIKTYASSVNAALCAAGHNVQLLSQLKLSNIRYVEVFDNYLAKMSDLANKSRKRLTLKQKQLNYLKSCVPFGNVKGEFHIDKSRQLEFSRELGAEWKNISGLQLNANVFNKAYAKSYLGLGSTQVKSSADVLFLTSPIPLHLSNRPTIVTVHDLIPLTHPNFMENWDKVAKLFGVALNQSLKKASAVICVSEFSKQELLKKFDVNPDKLKVIYPPCRFATSSFSLDASPKPQGIPEDYILYLGAIEPKKNLMSLLKAVEKNPHLPPLVIAGAFAWKSENERAMITKLKDRVIHEGYVTEDRLIQLIKHTKAFIFPSLAEGFGLPVLEAMWLNAPCIVSDIPVFHEIFKDHVTYIDPYCPDSISAAIEKVIATPVRKQSASWVQEQFSFEKFTREINALIQNIQ